jgi:UDP-perosamine 4-acetyltransferase
VALDESIAALVHDRAAVVFGAGGFAKSLIDLMRSEGRIAPVCAVDDDPGRSGDVLGAPIVGGREHLAALRAAGMGYAVNAVGAIGRIQDRIAIFELLDELGFELPTVVDPAAFVAPSATLAEGAQVFAGALVCSAATVGRGTIVNSGAIVSHDCAVGAYSHLAPGAILAGEVEVGDGVLVGMGVTASVGLRIGSGAIVGNSCVLRQDVPPGTILSAGSVWPRA